MIHVQELCKSFQGTPVLTGLNFHLDAGDRFALLGTNGSGKTVLLKIIATLMKPTSGAIEIAGYDAVANFDEVRPLIGYVPETFDGYPDLSVGEYLEFFAAAYKLGKRQRSAAIRDVLDLMDVTPFRERKVEQLSLGQKRRLCLAKTFLHEPLIWLLDAPMAVLDRRGQIEMETLIQELGAMGKTVVLATNRLADVGVACNRLGILNQGSLAFNSDTDAISQQFEGRHRLEIDVLSGIDAARAILEARSDLSSLEVTDRQIQIESQMTETEMAMLLTDLVHAGVTILRFQKTENWLESLFLEMTKPGITNEGG